MSKKLMIFDDDKDILFICTFVFEKLGWQVQTSENCNKILEVVGNFMPDVILMDNWIPEDGGIIATRQLKEDESLRHIPVIYFSANRDVETLAQQAQADTFIKKPFDLKELEDIVNKCARIPSNI
jgi:CheY-like chemotaxis protein